MQLRFFLSRISILLMRANWTVKLAVTAFAFILMGVFWWFVLQSGLVSINKNIIIELNDLQLKKNIFNQVMAEYGELNNRLNSNGTIALVKPKYTVADNYHLILNQAKLSNLNFNTYTTKKIKTGYQQLNFSFSGSYNHLLLFLNNIDRYHTFMCTKLKLVATGHRLQIAYVCGIHTSEK